MKLTRAEREELCRHQDPDIEAYLRAVETGRVGVLYDGGRGAGIEPRTDGTLRSYRGTLDALRAHLGATPWQDVTEPDLETWLHRPLTGAGGARGANTAKQNRTAVRGFYKWLVAYKRVRYDTFDADPSRFVRMTRSGSAARRNASPCRTVTGWPSCAARASRWTTDSPSGSATTAGSD